MRALPIGTQLSSSARSGGRLSGPCSNIWLTVSPAATKTSAGRGRAGDPRTQSTSLKSKTEGAMSPLTTLHNESTEVNTATSVQAWSESVFNSRRSPHWSEAELCPPLAMKTLSTAGEPTGSEADDEQGECPLEGQAEDGRAAAVDRGALSASALAVRPRTASPESDACADASRNLKRHGLIEGLHSRPC